MSVIETLVNELELGSHEHRWWMVNTALTTAGHAIQCQCRSCGATGNVIGADPYEWAFAVDAGVHRWKYGGASPVTETWRPDPLDSVGDWAQQVRGAT